MADTVQNIINDAFAEIMVYGPTQTPMAVHSAYAMRVLNRELDAWAALKRYVYANTFTAYTLTPNLAPHTIGPTGTFVVAQRPVRIPGAALILNNVTPNVDSPILNIRDAAWWNNQRVKSLPSAVPTDLYYEPDWPNGALNFWPVPNFAFGVRLQLWTLIAQFVNLTDAFSFPPLYKKALVLTLAQLLCRPFGRSEQADLVRDAAKARADLQTNNMASPRIASADYGTSGSGGARRGDFNYYSGQ